MPAEAKKAAQCRQVLFADLELQKAKVIREGSVAPKEKVTEYYICKPEAPTCIPQEAHTMPHEVGEIFCCKFTLVQCLPVPVPNRAVPDLQTSLRS